MEAYILSFEPIKLQENIITMSTITCQCIGSDMKSSLPIETCLASPLDLERAGTVFEPNSNIILAATRFSLLTDVGGQAKRTTKSIEGVQLGAID